MSAAARFLLLPLLVASVASAAPPPNDHFAAAAATSGAFWLTGGTLHEATSEPNEPILSGFPNGPTAWWRWTAPATRSVRVRTWGTERSNVLAVYRGSSLDTIRLVGYGTGYFGRGFSADVSFFATAGETYYLQVLGTEMAELFFVYDPNLPSRVQLSMEPFDTVAFVPPNDAFASAPLLTGNTAEVLVCNTNATSEAGEPLTVPAALSNTVWTSWTAPANGTWSVSSQATDFDNILAVYTGNAVNALTRINHAEFAPPGFPNPGGGRVTFRATAGTTYRFQLMGNALGDNEYGVCRITIQPATPPPNDHFANAAALVGPQPTGEGWATFATRETGEPGDEGDGSGSLWWRWTVPSTGLLAAVSYDGEIEVYSGPNVGSLTRLTHDPRSGTRSAGLGGLTSWHQVNAGSVVHVRGLPGSERVSFSLRVFPNLPNDDFANRQTLAGATANATVDLTLASWESGEQDQSPTAWYRWTAPATARYAVDTAGSPDFARLRVYTGSVLASLAPVGVENLLGTSPTAAGRVHFDAVAGTEYAIRIAREASHPGPFHVNVRPAPRPANDHFANAAPVAGGAWVVTGNNLDATAEIGEPFPSQQGSSPLSSLWWKWTAPSAGVFRLTTAGSGTDTIVSVYTGAAFGSMVEIAADQSGAWGSAGALVFAAQAGVAYTIRVDGQLRNEGPIRLALEPNTAPPNDAFSSRLPLGGSNTTATGTVLGATLEGGEPALGGANGGRSVWYDWTAPASGRAVITVAAERFNPAVGIYTGTVLAALTPALSGGSGAPAANPLPFVNSFQVSGGTSYKIKVDGAPATNGAFQIQLSMPAAPLNDAFSARSPLAGAVVRAVSNNEGATAQAGEPAHAGTAATHSIWFEWFSPATGTVMLDTIGGTGQPRLAIYTGAALNALTPVASDAITGGETYASLSFQATLGTTYLIALDTSTRSRGDLALNLVSAAAIPVNDAFDQPRDWTMDSGEDLVEMHGTSAEPGEPAHGGRPAARSRWWRWTPQSSRRALIWFETQDASLLARMAIYRDGPIGSLEPIAALTADGTRGRLLADVLSGETYRIVLDSPSVAAIPGWIRCGVAPANGTADYATPISPESGTISANQTGAANTDPSLLPSERRERWWFWTPEVNARMEWRGTGGDGLQMIVGVISGSSVAGIESSSQPVPGGSEVVNTFDALADHTYLLRVVTSTVQPVTVRLAESPRQAPPSNDLRYRATVLSGSQWSLPFTLGAETENQQWWVWTVPSDGVYEVRLAGTLAESDRLLAYANEEGPFSAGAIRTDAGPPVLRIQAVAGARWTFASETPLRRLRPATLSLAPAPGIPPANDSWLTPRLLAASWSIEEGDLRFASCQAGEPDHSHSLGTGAVFLRQPPGRSVWYRWTPATSAPVTLSLDAEAPLALRLYTGADPATWEFAFTEDLPPGGKSLAFHARAGQTYHIAVATRPPLETTGGFTLRIGGPPNDHFVNAIAFPSGGGGSSIESTGASVEDGEPGFGFSFEAPRASMWWKWTATATGSVWMDTLGSEFDTILSVFASDPPDTTARVAENDNATSRPGVRASALRFPAVAGRTYFIRICRRETTDPQGRAALNLSLSAPQDPYQRWLARYPELAEPDADDNADADHDGCENLIELAMGTSPLDNTSSSGLRAWFDGQNWQVEAAVDHNALEALGEGTRLELSWQVSWDLLDWQPGPPSAVVRHEGRLAVERITLGAHEPPFARLMVRRAR